MYSIDPGEFIRSCSRYSSSHQVWKELVAATRLVGFRQVSYQLAPELRCDDAEPRILSSMSPHPWVERSAKSALYKTSPIVRSARKSGKPFYWSSLSERTLADDDIRFLRERADSGVHPFGVTIPVFGPFRRHGYIGLDLQAGSDRLGERCLSDLKIISQFVHSFICDELAGPMTVPARLSKRESDALRLAAQGATNSEIAMQLNVAKSTADTFVRRAYEKLGAKDRVSAVLAFLERESL